MALDCGIIDHYYQTTSFADFMYQVGLVDSNGHKLLAEQLNKITTCIENRDFKAANDHHTKLHEVALNLCGFNSLDANLTLKVSIMNAISAYVQDFKNRRAIHVGNNKLHKAYSVEKYLLNDIMDSTIGLYCLYLFRNYCQIISLCYTTDN